MVYFFSTFIFIIVKVSASNPFLFNHEFKDCPTKLLKYSQHVGCEVY